MCVLFVEYILKRRFEVLKDAIQIMVGSFLGGCFETFDALALIFILLDGDFLLFSLIFALGLDILDNLQSK